MKHKHLKRVLALSLALAMVASSATFVYADDDKQNTSIVASDSAEDIDSEAEGASSDTLSYTEYRAKYKDTERPEVSDDEGYIYSSEKQPKYTGSSFPVTVKESGVYAIKINYEALAGGTDGIEFDFQIDGASPYDTASRVTLAKRWVNKEDIKQDANGNDIRPGQVEMVCWQ